MNIVINRLIPTIPLRLNYILWIEDILEMSQSTDKAEVKGVDIGTGASCIYPLLGARKNNWHFLATESDDFNFNFANRNVEKNLLSHSVKGIYIIFFMLLNSTHSVIDTQFISYRVTIQTDK